MTSYQNRYSTAGDSTLRNTSLSRFYRPATVPTNIPPYQANEYIYFDDCNSPFRFSMIWFRSVIAPKFIVCATCYERRIRYTPLGASFTGKLEELGDDGKCMFNVPRMKGVLWPLNRSSDNLENIYAYMRERSNLPRCPGIAGINGSEAHAIGMTWYTLVNNAIPDFVGCRACVEEHVKGKRFNLMFVPQSQSQGHTDQWSCDLAIPYVQRLLKTTSASVHWSGFVTGATHRMSLPQCVGFNPVKAESRTWYRHPAWPESAVCESCYLDQIALTSLERELEPRPVPNSARSDHYTCDLWSIPAQCVVSTAIERKSSADFQRFFRALMTNPACSPLGITGGKWYTLKGGCPNFEVCATCYAGLVTTHYLDNEFQPRDNVPPGQTVWCDFCAGIGRSMQYVNKFAEAVNSPHFDIFTSYVRRTSTIVPCQRNKPVRNKAWWRLNNTVNFYVCDDCYENAVRGTTSSDMFVNVGTTSAEMICCMYSPNMRQRYQIVCATNSPDKRTNFVAYANHRQSIYAQTVPVIRNILANAELKLLQQRMNNSTSTFYNMLDRTGGNATGIHYGPSSDYKTVYGSSATGNWYNTPHGITSERYSAQALDGGSSISSDTMRIKMLEDSWHEVE
ncbi:hypothetical protein P153DRAFT_348974 [Dothidotthia symphoricarpi CBS 119687]|uniref:Integral membrane protein n=1 Tax=Dothidotthia symphoricarpi CBS 119687 TaxID=1392245 RepID=A0A6A5ZZB7_9PLEO|nr:uncharacterized protein P153DRAFT_348974 [Dothidotthia symphoricarpi CBS 119687]KAF2124910.1 hypothetical protein P153DRAFT_348974 [Dothidotthia symphoricarpi CBS 119687]